MAFAHRATTIVCDAGPNTIPGPIDITGVVVPAEGNVTISKSGNTIATLGEGDHRVDLRSASGWTVTGACTLMLRLSRHD